MDIAGRPFRDEHRFFYENHDIKGFKTMVVMDRVKAGFALPIEF